MVFLGTITLLLKVSPNKTELFGIITVILRITNSAVGSGET